VLMGTEVPWSAVMQTVGKLSLLWVGGGQEAGSNARTVYIYIYVQQKVRDAGIASLTCTGFFIRRSSHA